jgi:hypothetical protein
MLEHFHIIAIAINDNCILHFARRKYFEVDFSSCLVLSFVSSKQYTPSSKHYTPSCEGHVGLLPAHFTHKNEPYGFCFMFLLVSVSMPH